MGRIKSASGFRLFVVLAAIAAPATAFAHAKLTAPKPRLDDDGIKIGPCGGTPRTKSFQQYQPGQTVAVTWREGIDHGGCFDVLFSPANDMNWVRLGRYDDSNLPAPTVYADASTTKMVTLPNVKCENCTLALRQLMNTNDALCNANTQDEMDGGVPTYFSCADIRVGDFPDASPSQDDGGTVTPPKDSGTSTTPTDGGGKFVDGGGGSSGSSGRPDLKSGDGGGCSMAMGATSGISFGVAGALLALALVRRRRNRSK